MMQAAGDGPCFDAPEGVNWSPRRRILVQGQAGSAPIVVARITAQQMEKVALSQDNHVIQTVPSGRFCRVTETKLPLGNSRNAISIVSSCAMEQQQLHRVSPAEWAY